MVVYLYIMKAHSFREMKVLWPLKGRKKASLRVKMEREWKRETQDSLSSFFGFGASHNGIYSEA